MRWKRWIKVSLLTMNAAAPVVGMLTVVQPASAAEPSASAEGNAVPIAKLVDAINSRSTQLEDRKDAAVQLISRNTSDATAQADVILKNTANPRAQIAIARALTKTANPDPLFIPDLQDLLGPDLTTTQAAAQALANFDGHPEAFDALQTFANNNSNTISIRAAVISAMGGIVDQKVADYLTGLLGMPNQSSAIQNAATDALGQLTGITTNGNDIHAWQQWWTGFKTKTPDQFRSIILGARFKQLQHHDAKIVEATSKQLRDGYHDLQKVDRSAAADLLVNYLNDGTPEIRIVGVELATDESLKIDKPVRRKLLSMVSDPDDDVRLQVVNGLLQLNDHTALDSLIAQLKVEKNAQIRARLAQALGKLEDLKAVPALVEMLHDRQPETITAAAKALSGNLGSKLRDTDPVTAAKVAVDLNHILDTTSGPGTDDLRAACVSALAALRDKLSFDKFRQWVQPGESLEVRLAALRGLGNLADTRANETVAEQLDDKDPTIRYEAAVALQTTATPDQAQFIFQRMKHDPAADDPEKELSDALWVAFQNLYGKESRDDLNRWATELTDAPDKRLITLQRLGEALAAAHDDKGVAQNEQAIAEAMVALKVPRYADAVAVLDKALDYWRGPGHGDSDKLEGLIDARLEDTLAAGQYEEATKFAAKQIALDPVYQLTVGPKIRNKAEDLSTKNPADAKVLIDAALQMNPPLETKYIRLLNDVQNEMKQRENAPPG